MQQNSTIETQQNNHAIELVTQYFTDQKLTYLHQNPVADGIVDEAASFLYSSARDYEGRKGLLDVIILE